MGRGRLELTVIAPGTVATAMGSLKVSVMVTEVGETDTAVLPGDTEMTVGATTSTDCARRNAKQSKSTKAMLLDDTMACKAA
jgi:hypothetical protein